MKKKYYLELLRVIPELRVEDKQDYRFKRFEAIGALLKLKAISEDKAAEWVKKILDTEPYFREWLKLLEKPPPCVTVLLKED